MTVYFRKILWLVAACVFVCRYTAFCAIPVDGYAAKVNDRVITVGEVIDVLKPVEAQLRQSCSGMELEKQLDDAYDKILDSLIERELIIADFDSKEMQIPDTIIDSRIDEIVHRKFQKSRMLLREQLEREGITMNEWREEIRNQIIVSLMREKEVDDRVSIAPGEVRESYDDNIDRYTESAQVELRMIVISLGKNEEDRDLKRNLAAKIRQRLVKGEDFARVAAEVSEGIKSDEGGYWGWIDPSSRREELAVVLGKLKPGEISEIVEAGNDLYIMTVEKRKSSAVIPFEDVEDEILDELKKAEKKRLFDEWIARLKSRAYIKKYD